jgi:dipeptidase E
MKTLLLLSSGSFLNNDLTDVLGKPLKDFRIANVINAAKGKGPQDASYQKLLEMKDLFKRNDCYFEDLDLDGKNEEELRDVLKNFDAVFVNGGSTFSLLKAIKESGFDKVMKELLPQGFVYIGVSAGSYVACPTIEMATWKYQDKYDHYGITDLTAMNLVPFLISAHYAPENKDLLKEKIAQAKYPTKVLSDEQTLFIKDDQVELLGGEEIKL